MKLLVHLCGAQRLVKFPDCGQKLVMVEIAVPDHQPQGSRSV